MSEPFQPTEWDLFFLSLARTWATKSKDPSTQVGAVIAMGSQLISGGFNGFARGVVDSPERLNDRSIKYALMLHAELNAALFAQRDCTGATLYCTHPSCTHCTAVMCQIGIKRAIFITPSQEFSDRWDPTWSVQQYKERGVEIFTVDDDKVK